MSSANPYLLSIRTLYLFIYSILYALLIFVPNENGYAAQKNPSSSRTLSTQPRQAFDLAVGNVTIETNTVIPGLQNRDALEGVFFIFGEAPYDNIPIAVHFRINDSFGNTVFNWTENHVINNPLPPTVHYEGRYRYPLPAGTILPLDYFTLTVDMELDPARADLFPGGVLPAEADLTNNSNQSTITRILQLSGKLNFGDITTTLTALDFFDPANNLFTGTALWNEDILVPFINLEAVRDDATMDLIVFNGEIPFTLPTIPYGPPPGVLEYNYRNGVLNNQGAFADLFWFLPPGVGYRAANSNFISFSEKPYHLGRLKLNQSLQFTGPVFNTNPTQWISEGLPFQIQTASAAFDPVAGLRLMAPVYSYQYAPHIAVPLGYGISSNDAYFQGTLSFEGEPIVTPNGLTANLQSADTTFEPGYPYYTQVKGKNLVVHVREGKILSAESGFDTVEISMTVGWDGCFGDSFDNVILGYNGKAKISQDGAAVIDEALTAPHEPRFNTYQFPAVNNAPAYIPGFRVPDTAATGQGANVAEYLQAMRERGSENLFSYGQEPFTLGNGLFAGFNIFPEEFNGKTFTAQVNNQPTTFTSTEWTKLYIRHSGYSGVVDALNQDNRFELYADPACGGQGYDVQLASFGQAYLDNRSEGLDTTTEGLVNIPWPSLITIPYEKMLFNACGNLAQGTIPAGVKDQNKVLAYWTAKIRVLTLAFEKRTPMSSDTDRTLWISTKNPIDHVADEATMQINLRPCGTIADSRIDQPLLTRYDDYPASLQKIYFSSFDGNPNQPNGFYNLLGDLHVSLFDPPRIHAIVNGFVGNLGDGSPWFGANDPDPNRDGFPEVFVSGAPTVEQKIAEYINANPVNVQTRFADLITLRYKLGYNSAKKEFRTQVPIKEDLILLDIDSAVEYLNQTRTEITFGVAVNGKPKVSLASKFSEISQDLQNSFLGPVRDKLEEAANSLRTDLSISVRPAMEPLLEPVVQEFVNQFQAQLALIPNTQDDIRNHLNQANGDFERILDDLMSRIDLHTLLTRRDNPAMQKIQDIKRVLNEVETALNFSPEQLSPVARAIFNHTVRGFESYNVDLNKLLEPVQKVRNEILAVLRDKIRPALNTAETVLDPALLLDSVFPLAEIRDQMVPQVKKAVKNALLSATQSGNYQTVLALQSKDITRLILSEIFNSIQFQKLTITANVNLQPTKNLLREQTETLLTSINQAVDNYVREQVGKLEGALAEFKGVKEFKGASLKGYAVVSGNTMEKLHIDGTYSSNTPDEVTYNGYLDITRLKVAYKGKNCTMPIGSGPVMDARIGSKDAELKIGGDKIKADIELQFMLNNGRLVNVGGSIYGRGTIRNGKLSMTDPGFRVSIGSDENYFIAFVKEIKFEKGKLNGGLFLGTTSCKDPLVEISKEADFLFAPGRFRGIYSYGEGTFNVIDYGCALRAGAVGGVSYWLFADGPVLGGKISAGIFGEAACTVQAKGLVTLLGSYDGTDFVYGGNGWIAGGIGFCEQEDWKTPEDVLDDGFCLACVASFDLLYKNGWSSKYHVECD